MQRNMIETLMGALVLVIAFSFGVFAYQSSSYKTTDSYQVSAKFDSVDGIGPGSDVRIGGIKIGVVDTLTLDSKSYRAVVTLSLQNGVPVPLDSTAAIVSEGLLGGKYVALEPGADEEMLSDGDEIEFTQSSVNLETLIGKFMFSDGDGETPVDSGASSGLLDEEGDEEDELTLGL